MVLGKLSVPRRPTNLDNSRAKAYCVCSRCGLGLFWTLLSSSIFSPFFLPLSETARYRLKCLKGKTGYIFSVSSPQRFLFPLNFTGRSTSLHFVNRPCIDHRGG